jgi:curved DNA-binding protein
MAQSLYDVLGVPKTADEDTIRKTFRKLAAKYHPDKNPGKDSEARFKEINRAHEVLSDKDKRALYDEFGEDSLKQGFDPERARMMRNFGRGRGGSVSFQDVFGGGAGDFSDVFGDMFGGGRGRRPRKAPDLEAAVSIEFVSAVKGTTVELRRDTGEIVTVRIPPGADEGSKLRIPGQATAPGYSQPGDLLLTVHVKPHAFFKREGDDLHLELPITLTEAYEGAKVRVPTPEGEVTLKVPPRTQSGQLSRLRGKGVAKKGRPAGDLYVKFLVKIPTSDAPEVQQAMEALKGAVEDPRVGLEF